MATTPPTQLFYVESTDENGGDLSLFVEAHSANDAVNLWHEWLRVFKPEDYAQDQETPARAVFRIPALTGAPRFFNWHTPDGTTDCDI